MLKNFSKILANNPLVCNNKIYVTEFLEKERSAAEVFISVLSLKVILVRQ